MRRCVLPALCGPHSSPLAMSAVQPASVAGAGKDALRASAAASVAPTAASPAAPAGSSSAASLPAATEHELAAVKQRIADVEDEIEEAKEARKACARGSDLWIRADDELKQLRDEKALLLKEKERKELALEREVHTRLLTRGFPVLSSAALVNSPSSTPAGSGKHQPAALAVKQLALLTAAAFEAQPVLESQIWAAAAAHAPDPLPWSTESDVQGFVKQALSDCIVSGGLQRQLRLSNEMSVDDQRPDVWVLHMGKHEGAALNLPVGVGEVKKPKGRTRPRAAIATAGPDDLPDLASLSLQSPTAATPAASPTIRSARLAAKAAAATQAAAASPATAAATAHGEGLDKPTLLGQIFDYMCLLRTQHGLRYVFGIVTNYAEWRIVWLPDTEPAAQATKLPFDKAQSVDPNTPLMRELHGTRIYRGDDPSLIRLLVSMLHKMARSPHEPPAQLVDSIRPRWRVAEVPPYHWKRLTNFTLKLLQAVDVRSASFFLLQDYRGGADGRVWLVAAESSGALGVIKFPRRHLARHHLEVEAELWKTVWGARSTRVVVLADEPALLMPFAFHAHRRVDGSLHFLPPDHLRPDQPVSYLSDVDASELDALIAAANADPMAIAEEAVRAMAEAQYEHLDVHWRHVAFVVQRHPETQALQRQAVLIDLGRVSRLPSVEASVKADAVIRMLVALA